MISDPRGLSPWSRLSTSATPFTEPRREGAALKRLRHLTSQAPHAAGRVRGTFVRTCAMMGHEMRVLVLSASVGAGHVRAAEAVEAALRKNGEPVTIVNCDVLTFMPQAFRKIYSDGYFEMVRRAPQLLGW